MDSRDSSHHQNHNNQHQIHHYHHQQQQQQHQNQHLQQQQQLHHPFGVMGTYGLPNNRMSSPNSGNMMHPSFTYPFNHHIMSAAAAGTNSKLFYSPITNNNNNHSSDNFNKSSMSNNGLSYDSGLPQRPSLSLEPQQSGEKRKRGRPRKCVAEGTTALGLSNSSIGDDDFSPPAIVSAPPPRSGDSPVKRGRGRPPGSGKKQLDALGPGGVGFTPHVIMCEPGEDIASKIVAFSRQATRTVCIVSAYGAISSVTLKKPSLPGGTLKYEDQYQIISLLGSFTFSESCGDRINGLTISLAGKDGQILGGEVAGELMAATPVQVIAASFALDVKKPNSNTSATKPSSGQLVPFGGPMAAGAAAAAASSPPSNGDGSNDSSDENGSTPLDGTALGQTFNNGIQTNHGIPYNWPQSR